MDSGRSRERQREQVRLLRFARNDNISMGNKLPILQFKNLRFEKEEGRKKEKNR